MAEENKRALLHAEKPYWILSLSGGGVCGIIETKLLSHIERILARLANRESVVLSDYFDMIGGTSTGSIIAAGLALKLPQKKNATEIT
jgi:patatin-like phospholipase/acyl hydrolase